MLMLDALFPPAPDQLVQDCRQVGAGAVARYWWRPPGFDGGPQGSWTPEHDQKCKTAGILEAFIVVPGNTPPNPLDTLTGLRSVVVIADIETNSLPPREWLSAWCTGASQVQGCRVLRYGDLPVLQGYPPCQGDWVSHGLIPVRAGVIDPVPVLPSWPAVVADQYAVGCVINGNTYDASVVDPTIFAIGDDMFEDADRARLADKLSVFEVAAGKSRYVAGPDQNTYFNLVSQGDAGGVTTVRVFTFDVGGNVLGVLDYKTVANAPNLKGPQQAAGQTSQLGATGPGVTLGFVNQGPDDVMVSIH